MNEWRQLNDAESDTSIVNPEIAKIYIDWIKNKSKHETTSTVQKSKIHKELMSHLWNTLTDKQDREFDEVLAKRVLNQSRYEKQMMRKLFEVCDYKTTIAENQKLVEEIMINTKEVEAQADIKRKHESCIKNAQDEAAETRRMEELRSRLHEEKIRKLCEYHHLICQETLQDLINMALNSAEYRQINDGVVPKTVWSVWRALFIKCNQILDAFGDEELEEEEEEEVSPQRLRRIQTMRNAAFKNYHQIYSPWDEFASFQDEDHEILELGQVVLGYIVHRLLNLLYSEPLEQKELIPKFEIKAIIIGVPSSAVLQSFQTFFEKSNIKIVRMEDAINYCLQEYKNQMANIEYIDLNIIAATEEVVRWLRGDIKGRATTRRYLANSRSGKSKIIESFSHKATATGGKIISIDSKENKTEEEKQTVCLFERQTQTPRLIPFDDIHPILTDAAYIGMRAYEFLALGEPISDELATKILIEYLRSLITVERLALINYPFTYEQMACLETALTGHKILPQSKSDDLEDLNIDSIECAIQESVCPRIVYKDEYPSGVFRNSRLLPNPIARHKSNKPKPSFATVYIKVSPKPHNVENDARSYEVLPINASSVDKFYTHQKIAYCFYYVTFDPMTLTEMAKLVLDEETQDRISEEYFEPVMESTKHGANRMLKAPLIRRFVIDNEEDIEYGFAEEEETDEESSFDYNLQNEKSEIYESKPGDKYWKWIDYPLPFLRSNSLARFWEIVEKTYLEDVTENLYLKNLHSSGVVPYKNFLITNLEKFIERKDNKQSLLNDFRQCFNAIDPNLRRNEEVKSELHRRVADFQARLWEICDQNRKESESDRLSHINDQWTVFEGKLLTNIYIGMFQAEIDRCFDTVQLIQNYYLEMLEKPMPFEFFKIILNTTPMEPIRTTVDQEEPKQESETKANIGKKSKEQSKNKVASPKIISIPSSMDHSIFEKQITDMLIDPSKEFNPEDDLVSKTILNNFRYVVSKVDEITLMINEMLSAKESEGPKTDDKLAKRKQDLISEWRQAAMYEVHRIRFRLELLIGAANADIAFLLNTMRGTFHRMYDEIIDRYWREMKSVNELISVFCFAIEDVQPIKNQLILDGDRFIMIPVTNKTKLGEFSPWRFGITQLFGLMNIFKQIAPQAIFKQDSLIYILQDLVSQLDSEDETMILPSAWQELSPSDITNLVHLLFESEEQIDWREFLIYALELNLPDHREILEARDRFRFQDSELKEIVSRDQYDRIPLWFIEHLDMPIETYEVVREFLQSNRMELHDEALISLKQILDTEIAKNFEETQSQTSFTKLNDACTEDILRLVLAKELLCQMYLISADEVNYTALLLAFCKDENPCKGFGKALTLAVGNRVCVDIEEGERYAEKLLQNRRLLRDKEDECKSLFPLSEEENNKPEEEIMNEEYIELSPAYAQPIRICSKNVVGHETYLFSDDYEGGLEEQELVVYWLSKDVCLTVLGVVLPEKSSTLSHTIDCVYEELWDENLCTDKDSILAHRLLNHEFIIQLLNHTKKFTSICIGEIIEKILCETEEYYFD